ncbi:DUF6916 family protein [Paenibacillus tyrfis]|uniref:DUF6916 family protein n=1 Tax=Paenibacillus tyrfis TaxID=1501230 RepID=UPI000B59466C|nr:hypothetical protein [Paenibacillus tyrfis]
MPILYSNVGDILRADSFSSFHGVLHTSFKVLLDESEAELILIEAKDTGTSPDYEQFSLLFAGPPEPFLPQQIYLFKHPQLGELHLFMVPVGKNPEGFLYEVIFSRPLAAQ